MTYTTYTTYMTYAAQAGPDELLDDDARFMGEALRQAARAAAAGEVPCGAVIVRGGRVIARAANHVETLQDAPAPAELLALTPAAAAVAAWRLADCDLYVTKEPCPMCAGAMVHARLRRVIFGCGDPRGGAAGGLLNLLQHPSLNHRCAITPDVRAEECGEMLRAFFRARRAGGGPPKPGALSAAAEDTM